MEDFSKADLDVFARVDLVDTDGSFLPVTVALDVDGLDVQATRPFPRVLGARTSSTTADFASSSPESEFSSRLSETPTCFDRVRETARVFLVRDLGRTEASVEVFFE